MSKEKKKIKRDCGIVSQTFTKSDKYHRLCGSIYVCVRAWSCYAAPDVQTIRAYMHV